MTATTKTKLTAARHVVRAPQQAVTYHAVPEYITQGSTELHQASIQLSVQGRRAGTYGESGTGQGLTGSRRHAHQAALDISGYKSNQINTLCHPNIELAVLGSSGASIHQLQLCQQPWPLTLVTQPELHTTPFKFSRKTIANHCCVRFESSRMHGCARRTCYYCQPRATWPNVVSRLGARVAAAVEITARFAVAAKTDASSWRMGATVAGSRAAFGLLRATVGRHFETVRFMLASLTELSSLAIVAQRINTSNEAC